MAKNVRVGSLAGSAKTLEKIDGSIDNNDYTPHVHLHVHARAYAYAHSYALTLLC